MTKKNTNQNITNVMPNQWILEDKLIGYIYWKPDSVFPYDNVDERLFYNENYKSIYNIALYLWKEKRAIDEANIYSLLSEKQRQTITLEFLNKIKNQQLEGYEDFKRTVEVLLEYRIRREKIIELSNCMNAMYDLNSNIELEISKITNTIDIFTEKDNTVRTMTEVWEDEEAELMKRMKNGSAIAGMKSGIYALDMSINGFQKGELVCIAGRPSMGKTAVSVSIALGLAKNNYSGLFFTLEQADIQILEKIICNECNIPGWDITTGTVKPEQLKAIKNARKDITSLPLKMDSNPRTNVSRISKLVAKEKKRGNLDFIVIDYLTYMDSSDCDGKTENDKIEKMVKELKIIAKEHNICVVLLAQLNRECEKRENKRPLKSDLRGSGSIEQEADKILLLYRDEYYNKMTTDKGILEIEIAKFRNGQLGTIKTKFEGEYQRISSFNSKNTY